jgi:hypothetical protein
MDLGLGAILPRPHVQMLDERLEEAVPSADTIPIHQQTEFLGLWIKWNHLVGIGQQDVTEPAIVTGGPVR